MTMVPLGLFSANAAQVEQTRMPLLGETVNIPSLVQMCSSQLFSAQIVIRGGLHANQTDTYSHLTMRKEG